MVKDVAYAIVLDKKDGKIFRKLSRYVWASIFYDIKHKLIHNTTITDYFFWKCEQAINDHKPIVKVGNQSFEFEQIAKADDLVTFSGHQKYIDKVLGNTTDDLQWMAKGTGATEPVHNDAALQTQHGSRVDMNAIGFGWRDYGGLQPTARFAGIWGESEATVTVTESAIFTLSAAGTLINRNQWLTNGVTHTVNKSVLIIGSLIEWIPLGGIN